MQIAWADSDLPWVDTTAAQFIKTGAQQNNEVGDLEIMGLVVNGAEVTYITVYRQGDRFLLPARETMQEFGIQASTQGQQLKLDTPSGSIPVNAKDFYLVEEEIFFSDRLIDEVLHADWKFEPASYVIDVVLPWWRMDAKIRKDDQAPEIEFKPFPFAMSQMRVDHTRFWSDGYDSAQTDWLMRGRVAGGTWRAELSQYEDQDLTADEYYWQRDFEKGQTLLGYRPVSLNPLVPIQQQTGLQQIYNSEGFEFDPWSDRSRNQYIRRLGLGLQTIEGEAKPGSIAELQINGRIIQRQRVRLDGSYRFDDVQRPDQQYQEIFVRILDQRNYNIIDVQNFSKTPSDLLLNRRQNVSFLGFGVTGDLLSDNDSDGDPALMVLTRYGITDALTVEAGAQAGLTDYQVMAITAGLGEKWVASASLANHASSTASSAELFGRGERWYADVHWVNRGDSFLGPDSLESDYVDLRYEHSMTDRFSLGAYGRHVDTQFAQISFLLPGMSWRFGHRNSMRLWPDANGDYVLDVRTHHRDRDWLQLSTSKDYSHAEYRWFGSETYELFASAAHRRELGGLVEAGALWYPRSQDDRAFIRASLLLAEAGAGYRLSWVTALLPGLYSSLEVRDEPESDLGFDTGLQAMWTLSVDLSFVGGKPIPARNNFTNNRLGAIAGRLRMLDEAQTPVKDVEKIAISLDGVIHFAQVNNGHYHLGNLRPGNYQVRLGAEHLPMELSPAENAVWVQVAEAATTKVDLHVRAEFGFMGRLSDSLGKALPNIRLTVADKTGTLRAQAFSDEYGYYRFGGLPPGDYQLQAQYGPLNSGFQAKREISLVDRFLFDINLELPVQLAKD